MSHRDDTVRLDIPQLDPKPMWREPRLSWAERKNKAAAYMYAAIGMFFVVLTAVAATAEWHLLRGK